MIRSSLLAMTLAASCATPVLAQTYPLNYTPNPSGGAASVAPSPIFVTPGNASTVPQAPAVSLPPRATGSTLPPVVDDVMTVGAPRPGPIDPSQPTSRDAVVQRPGGSDTSPGPNTSPSGSSRSLVGVRFSGSAHILAHSTASGHPFHEHPAGRSMNIQPPS